MKSDAPFCDVCGHITVRNGARYKCLNCGTSLDCSYRTTEEKHLDLNRHDRSITLANKLLKT